MADAGSLLGQLLGAALSGGSVRGGQSGAGGGALGDLLGQVLAGGGQQPAGQAAPGGGLPGGLGDLLGQVLGGGAAGGRAQGAPAGLPGGLPGGLGDLLGQVLGGAGQPRGGAAGGAAGGLGDLLGQILGGGAGGGGGTLGGSQMGGGQAGGGLGDLAQDALGGTAGGAQPSPFPAPAPAPAPQAGPKPTTQPSGGNDLVKYGGLAVIGMLAFNAFRKWQAQGGQGRAAFTSGTPDAAGFTPTQAPGGADAFSGVLLAAMAGAAQADGQLDQDELNRITGGMARMGVPAQERDALITFLATPVDPQQIVDAATTPEAALQIYAASAMAIRPDSAEEKAYLAALARAIGIDPGLKAQVDADLNA